MEKDFDSWNKRKKSLDVKCTRIYTHPREVWWCSLGINIGVEIDGKNANFERPVLVMNVYNKASLLALPLSSKEKNDQFHYPLQLNNKTIWAALTQVRVISSKRLLRKVGVIEITQFEELKASWSKYL